jgi:peptidoglycan/LPS O-acetylase OafA/YrhL
LPLIERNSATPVDLFGARIPALDGLRALSIANVILCHSLFTMTGGVPRATLQMIFGTGSVGVDMFFVISGFLITGLLLREEELTRGIDLGLFYLKRAFRILPPLLFMLAVTACLISFWNLGSTFMDEVGAIFFFNNFRMDEMTHRWPLRHTWTLSLEEQFYLIWPGLLAFCGREKGLKIAVGLLIAAPLFRVICSMAFPNIALGTFDGIRPDMLMTGCALAFVIQRPGFVRFCRVLYRFWLPAVAAVYIFFFSNQVNLCWNGAFLRLVGFSLSSAAIALVLAWVIHNPDHPMCRPLQWRGVVHIGKISYGIYLWQQLFFHPDFYTPITRFPLNLVAICAIAELSYRWVEQPALELRKRITERFVRASSSENFSEVLQRL